MNSKSYLMFSPSRLTQARNLRTLSKKELAEAIGVTPSAITQFEAGINSPSVDTMSRIASTLDMPVGYFSTGRAHFQASKDEIHFRSLRSTPAKERRKAESYIELLREVINLFEASLDFPETSIPKFSSLKYTPEEAARELRKYWKIPLGPVQNFVNVLEMQGIFISIADFPEMERIGAFSVWLENKAIIQINKKRTDNVYLQRFTLAHELGHLVMHEEAIPGDKIQEKEADRFAAEFLMPKSIMIFELPRRYNLAKLVSISQHWGVSIEALLYRSKELGLLSEQSTRRGFIGLNLARKNNNITYPKPDTYLGEVPRMISKASNAAGYSTEEISDRLQLPPKLIRQIMGIETRMPELKIV